MKQREDLINYRINLKIFFFKTIEQIKDFQGRDHRLLHGNLIFLLSKIHPRCMTHRSLYFILFYPEKKRIAN